MKRVAWGKAWAVGWFVSIRFNLLGKKRLAPGWLEQSTKAGTSKPVDVLFAPLFIKKGAPPPQANSQVVTPGADFTQPKKTCLILVHTTVYFE